MSELLVIVRRTPNQGPEHPPRERVAAQRRAARLALDEAATLEGLTVGHWPQEEDGGRPLPVEGWHWSISHDSALVAAVLHREPVGVDLERVAERRAALRERVAKPVEQELLAPWGALAFTRLWTAKEAVLKAAGVGIAELSACRLQALDGEDLILEHRAGLRRVVQHRYGEHILAVHTRELDQVRWNLPG